MSRLPRFIDGWDVARKIAYLDNEIAEAEKELRDEKAWRHHRDHAARVIRECREEIDQIRHAFNVAEDARMNKLLAEAGIEVPA